MHTLIGFSRFHASLRLLRLTLLGLMGCGFCLLGAPHVAQADVSVAVSVYPANGSICVGGTATLSATLNTSGCENGSSGANYQWYSGTPGSGTAITGANSASYVYSSNTPTTVSLYCTVTVPSCGSGTSSAVSITVSSPFVSASPYVSSSGNTTCNTFFFYANAAEVCGSNSLYYHWTFGDGQQDYTANPTHRYAAPSPTGGYPVTLTVTDQANSQIQVTCSLSVTVTAPTAPGAPTSLTAIAVSPTEINLSWQAPAGGVATGYNVYRSVNGGSYSFLDFTPSTSYQDKTVSAGSNYSYKVTAYACTDGANDGGVEGEGPASSPTPSNPPCVTSINVSVTAPTQPVTIFPGVSTAYSASAQETCGNGSISYQWTFGDGGTASGSSPSYPYLQTGDYRARVTAMDGLATTYADAPLVRVWDFNLLLSLPNVTQGTTATGSLQVVAANNYPGPVQVSLGARTGKVHVSLIDPNNPSPCPDMLTGTNVVVVAPNVPITVQVCADPTADTTTPYTVTVTGTDESGTSGTSPQQHQVSAQGNVLVSTASSGFGGRNPHLALNTGMQEPPTLLDEVGRLAHAIPSAQIAIWQRTLHGSEAQSSGLPSTEAVRERLAVLHLRLGEYKLAAHEQPGRAQWHFRRVQQLSGPQDSAFGLAVYDSAIALFYAGAYADAADTFHQLTLLPTALPGYSRQRSALWARRAAACAGYHAERSAMGIPEPPRLDPQCGAAALAAALQSLSLPFDRATVMASCRVTGEGSNLADLVAAGPKLHVLVRPVMADDRGLMLLPKPLVAYVEHDHFISVIKADQKGVTYLCSDCGMWPGGQVRLTWRQWHALDPGVYATITQPAGFWDKALTQALAPHPLLGVKIASLAGVMGLGQAQTLKLWHTASLLRGRVILFNGPTVPITCGAKPSLLRPSPFGQTPHHGDPVNLATGEEEYSAPPDLVVYNPHGPAVIWKRSYNSYRGPEAAYEPNDFGAGWSQPYNIGVYDDTYPDPYANPPGTVSAGTKHLYFENGAQLSFTAPAVPNSTPPPNNQPTTTASSRVACTFPSNEPGVPLLIEWDYDSASPSGHYVITFKNRTRWVTTIAAPGVKTYPLSQIIDRNGNGLKMVYNNAPTPFKFLPDNANITLGEPNENIVLASLCNWPTLAAIRDLHDTGTTTLPLLSIGRDPSSRAITGVVDAYGRSVYYTSSLHPNTGVPCGYPQSLRELDAVSQVVPSTTSIANAPPRYHYGYANYKNGDGAETTPYLAIIDRPRPDGTSTWGSWSPVITITNPSRMIINYDVTNASVGSVIDANGNASAYFPSGASTIVHVNNAAGQTINSFTVAFNDPNLNETSRTDGAGNTVETEVYGDQIYNPNLPTSVTLGSTQATHPTTWTYTYDIQNGVSYGNLKTATSPRGTTTTYGYDYSQFAMGDLTSVQEGTKTATQMTYYPDGLLWTLKTPAPNTVATSSQFTTTTYSYDGLGDLLSVQTPAPNSTTGATVTTMYGYTSDSGDAAHSIPAYTPPATSPSGEVLPPTPWMGEPLTVTDPRGKVTHFRYTTDPAFRYSADGHGNLAGVYDALGNRTDLAYNLADQQLAVAYPPTYQTGSGQSSTHTAYLFPGGPVTSVTQLDESAAIVRQVTAQRGKEGEVLSLTGSTEPVYYTYDALYRLSTVADGNSNSTTHLPATHYYYNTQGYLDAMTFPGYGGPTPAFDTASGTWSNISGKDSVCYRGYDLFGHAAQRIDGNGVTTHYEYNDYAQQLTHLYYTYPTGYTGSHSGDVAFHYDGYGRRDQMADAVSGTLTTTNGVTSIATPGVTYGYDDDDDLMSVITKYAALPSAASITYTYDQDGSRATMGTPAGTFSYTYDNAGQLQSLTNPYSEQSQWVYKDNGWLQSQQLGNNAITTYSYDALGRLTDVANKNASATLLSEFSVPTYNQAAGIPAGYDGVGSLKALQVTVPGATGYSGTTTFTYDAGSTDPTQQRSQLTQESSTRVGGYTSNFGYDAAGNPTTLRGATRAFNSDNQYTGSTYDNDGNPTHYNGRTLVFDPENRLTKYGNPTSSGGMAAGYNGDGLRAWKQNASGTSYFLYDGTERLLKLDSTTGTVTAVNTEGANGLLARRTVGGSNPGTTYYTFDLQGNTAQYLSSTGAIQSTNLYDAAGLESSSDTNTSDPYGYGAQAGYQTDNETGLLLLTNRYYDPSSGQFLTRDPSGYAGGINLYGYVGNNFANDADPMGTSRLSDWYWGGMGGLSGFADTYLMNGSVGNFGDTLGRYDSGCAYMGEVVMAGANVAGNAAMLFTPGGEEVKEAELAERGAKEALEIPCPLLCFPAGTAVQMADGSTKAIEQVRTHDLVKSRDPQTGKDSIGEVVSVQSRVARDVVQVQLTDAKTGHVETISCTPEHPFFVAGQGWTPAGALGIGSSIVTRAGPSLSVQGLDWVRASTQTGTQGQTGAEAGTLVYNLEVAETHTFFVGLANGGAWVHNKCDLEEIKYRSGGKWPETLEKLEDIMPEKGTNTGGGAEGSYGKSWPLDGGGTIVGEVHGPSFPGENISGHNTLHYHINDANGSHLGTYLPGDDIP